MVTRTSRNFDKATLPSGFNIYMISDTHIDETLPLNPGTYGTYSNNTLPNLSWFIEQCKTDEPDLILHGGDMVNGYHNAFEWFKTEWDKLPSTIPSMIVPGNHDYDSYIQSNLNGLTANEYVATGVGYNNLTPHIGSYFNQTQTITKDDLTVKIISIDLYQDEDGLYKALDGGYISSELFAWIETELNTTADVVILLSHEGITLHDDDETTLYTLLETTATNNPNLRIFHLHGHQHQANVETTTINDQIVRINTISSASKQYGGFIHINIGATDYTITTKNSTKPIHVKQKLPQSSRLIKELHFNEGIGSIITDYSIYNNNITHDTAQWIQGGAGYTGSNSGTGNGSGKEAHTIFLLFYLATTLTSSSGGRSPLSFPEGVQGDVVFGSATSQLTNEIITVMNPSGRCGWCSNTDSVGVGWHLLELVWDGSKYSICLDGDDKPVTVTGTPSVLVDNGIKLGVKNTGSGFFIGRLGYLAVYDTVLSGRGHLIIRNFILNQMESLRKIEVG